VQYFISLNEEQPAGLDTAFAKLRQITGDRIEAHISPGEPAKTSVIYNISRLLPESVQNHIPALQSFDEAVILLLALVPHLIPGFFENIVAEKIPSGGDFPEFGGIKATNHRGILPTGETAQFILAGNDISGRLTIAGYFEEEHFFYRNRILWLEPVREGEPKMSGRIVLADEWVDRLVRNKESAPRFGIDFPARKVHTDMTWEDIVLHPQTNDQIRDISNWLQFGSRLFQDANLKRKIKPGYRVLFYGPSGTGKTLTAALLGKQYNKDVYRVDLSQIVSKFIGETEKNLESVFRRAESKDWILFFDEADALFGKRTNVQNAHDKYANQEVSYLLQRVEDYPGLMILATNFKNNLDDAFIRRFHALVHFPVPGANDRFVLWKKSLPAGLPLDHSVDLLEIAGKYELSGASILNAVQFAVMQCFSCNDELLNKQHIHEGIRRELQKEERTMY